jgi:hypothetical protein
LGGRDQEGHCLKPIQERVHKTLPQKNPIQKKADRVAQVVECLLSKCEDLSSKPVPQKRKEGRKEVSSEYLEHRKCSINIW